MGDVTSCKYDSLSPIAVIFAGGLFLTAHSDAEKEYSVEEEISQLELLTDIQEMAQTVKQCTLLPTGKHSSCWKRIRCGHSQHLHSYLHGAITPIRRKSTLPLPSHSFLVSITVHTRTVHSATFLLDQANSRIAARF
ncbi:hypothetical protein ACTXT7_009982 [Hymenolepis weldensis]